MEVNGIKMCSLLDTGAQVSTMTESFYRNHMADFGDLVDITDMLRISAANGGDIRYLGYIECNLKALGYTFENMEFLVVRDPSEDTLKQRKRRVPGVLGSNIFKSMKVLCDSIEILPKNWGNILALYEEIYENDYIGKIRIPNHHSIIIPRGSVQIIEIQTKPAPKGEKLDCIVEENTGLTLPNGFALASTLVSVTDTGRIPVQICNYSNIDINFRPRTLIGTAVNITTPSFQIAEMNTQTACSVDINSNGILKKMEVGSLTEEQERQVRNLIIKYKDTFSKSEDDIGFCDKIEHHIPTSDNIPVRIPHRRIPPNQWSEVREYLQNALKMCVIQESSSPYAAPVVIIPKKNGKLRMCVDFRGLNAKTRKDAYPLPRIEEALDALNGAKYFCSLDLAHGFHQLPVASEDIEKTAFRVGTGGLYDYLRMPFELTGSPGTFMRLMDKIFGDQKFQTILTYLDDILVFGRDFNETLERLEMVLSRLKANNLKIRPEKCQLFKEQLRYLGHLISERGMAPDDEKIKAITDWQKPKTDIELRGFLGLAGYYRRFVPQFAKLAGPLHNLLKGKGQKQEKEPATWNWRMG